MSQSVSLAFKGSPQFERRIRRAPASLAQDISRNNLNSAEEMAAIARGDVPVLSGAARRSIKVTRGGKETPGIFGAWIGDLEVLPSTSVRATAAAVTAGDDDAPYVHWIEYGTYKMAAQPFFWPAYWEQRRNHFRRSWHLLMRSF